LARSGFRKEGGKEEVLIRGTQKIPFGLEGVKKGVIHFDRKFKVGGL